MRSSSAEAPPNRGLSGSACPVIGSRRSTVPSKPVGSPPSRGPGCGARRPLPRWRLRSSDARRRIAARVDRRTVLPVIDEVEAGAIAARTYTLRPSKRNRPDRVAGILLAPVLHEDRFGSGRDVALRREPRQAGADDAAVSRGPRWTRACTVSHGAEPHRGAVPPMGASSAYST